MNLMYCCRSLVSFQIDCLDHSSWTESNMFGVGRVVYEIKTTYTRYEVILRMTKSRIRIRQAISDPLGRGNIPERPHGEAATPDCPQPTRTNERQMPRAED